MTLKNLRLIFFVCCGCSIEVQEKSLKMPMFPMPLFLRGELLKHMYAFLSLYFRGYKSHL